jgi:hypothetical protein
VETKPDQNFGMHGINYMEVKFAPNQEDQHLIHRNLNSVQILLMCIKTFLITEGSCKADMNPMVLHISVQIHMVYLKIE